MADASKRLNLYCTRGTQPTRFLFKITTVMDKTYGNWIYMQCAKWGRVTFGKESLKAIFTTTDQNLLRQLKAYCSTRKLKMQMDSTKSLFTFQVRRSQLKLVH